MFPANGNKVNGAAKPGESLTAPLEYITFTTTVDIRPLAAGSATSQAALEKLIEVIATQGQPVITGTPFVSGGNYVFEVAIEHAGAWSTRVAPTDLVTSLVANQFAGQGFTAGNTAVAFASTL